MHFSVTDLPVPEPPMMTRLSPGITLSVDAGEHLLAAEGLADVAELDARRRRAGGPASEEGLGQQVVGGEDQDRGGDHGVGRRLADALGAAAGVEAVVAAHQRRG